MARKMAPLMGQDQSHSYSHRVADGAVINNTTIGDEKSRFPGLSRMRSEEKVKEKKIAAVCVYLRASLLSWS